LILSLKTNTLNPKDEGSNYPALLDRPLPPPIHSFPATAKCRRDGLFGRCGSLRSPALWAKKLMGQKGSDPKSSREAAVSSQEAKSLWTQVFYS